MKLPGVRWGVRGVLALGVAASTIANILHAEPNGISRTIAAWPPLALLLTIELMARIPVNRMWLAIARLGAAGVIAGIAAWVSYWHMAGVAARYGESSDAAHLLPLSVDGLIVVASICLVELGGRIRAEGGQVDPQFVPGPVEPDRESVPELDAPAWEEPAAAEVDKVATPGTRARKPHPSSRDRVAKAHERTPAATNEQLARRLNLSTKTVAKYRPDRQQPPEINGRVAELEGVP